MHDGSARTTSASGVYRDLKSSPVSLMWSSPTPLPPTALRAPKNAVGKRIERSGTPTPYVKLHPILAAVRGMDGDAELRVADTGNFVRICTTKIMDGVVRYPATQRHNSLV